MLSFILFNIHPDNKVPRAHLGPQDPGGPYVGPKNFAIWAVISKISNQSSLKNYLSFSNVPVRAPLYWHGLNATPACLSDYIMYKVWKEIT